MSTNANNLARTLARSLFINLPTDADWTTDYNGTEVITLADSMIAIGDDEDGLTWTRYTGNSEDGWDYSETDGTPTRDWSDEDTAKFVASQAAWLTA